MVGGLGLFARAWAKSRPRLPRPRMWIFGDGIVFQLF